MVIFGGYARTFVELASCLKIRAGLAVTAYWYQAHALSVFKVSQQLVTEHLFVHNIKPGTRGVMEWAKPSPAGETRLFYCMVMFS